MKKSLPVIIIILLIAIGALVWQLNKEEVQKPGEDVLVTENIGNESEKLNLIRIEYPRPNQAIISPIVIKGKARGNWFFEASFPVLLKDWNGNVIAQGIAQAKGDWMTTEFVPFEATLNFKLDKTSYGKSGFLILRKDNPSGLIQNDDALNVPVKFGEVSEPVIAENVAGLNQKILNNGVYITPTQVVSDSRCPSDVDCFWAGEILIKVKLEKGNEMKVVELKEGESATIGGSKVTFINALPEKKSTVTTKDSDYKFMFKVE
jgi:hypothetical protein